MDVFHFSIGYLVSANELELLFEKKIIIAEKIYISR
jgi:hypothetical protein